MNKKRNLKDKILNPEENAAVGADKFWKKNALTNMITLLEAQIEG